MRHAKLIVSKSNRQFMLGKDAQIVDLETGEPIDCAGSFTLTFPIKGIVSINAEIFISEIEVVDKKIGPEFEQVENTELAAIGE